MVAFVPSAQPWSAPAASFVNVPPGGLVRPFAGEPQQPSVPCVVMPQVCRVPAESAMNFVLDGGGEACAKVLSPQHTAAPSAVSAQAWFAPAAGAKRALARAVA